MIERALQVLWVLDYLDDLEADFLRFYNIYDLYNDIESRRFFSLAFRVSAYGGVMSARVGEDKEQQEKRKNQVKGQKLMREAGQVERVKSTKPSYIHEALANAE